MTHRISMMHRAWLLAAMVLLGALGLAFAVVPGAVLERMGLDAPERVLAIIRVGSSTLLAETIVVGIALRSGSWTAIRLVTILLVAHFTIETVVRVVSFSWGESDSLVAAVPQAVIAAGLGLELVRQRRAGRTASAEGLGARDVASAQSS